MTKLATSWKYWMERWISLFICYSYAACLTGRIWKIEIKIFLRKETNKIRSPSRLWEKVYGRIDQKVVIWFIRVGTPQINQRLQWEVSRIFAEISWSIATCLRFESYTWNVFSFTRIRYNDVSRRLWDYLKKTEDNDTRYSWRDVIWPLLQNVMSWLSPGYFPSHWVSQWHVCTVWKPELDWLWGSVLSLTTRAGRGVEHGWIGHTTPLARI